MVKDHYHNLGFKKEDKFWILDIKKYKLKESFIKQN